MFRSTLEFTRLDKAKVKAIIQELKEGDLDLMKSSTRSQNEKFKICCCSEKSEKIKAINILYCVCVTPYLKAAWALFEGRSKNLGEFKYSLIVFISAIRFM